MRADRLILYGPWKEGKDQLRQQSRQFQNGVGYSLIAPWLVGFFGFVLIPMIASGYLSFTRYDLLSPSQWTGFSNFSRMFTSDRVFWQSVRATLIYVFASVPLQLAFALIVAMILSKRIRGIGVYRTLYYLPSLLGQSVAVAVMWRRLFGENGAVQSILQAMHLPAETCWIGDAHTAIWTLVLLNIWQFGSAMVVFLAGIKNIPDIYYEAATVDGASSWQKFWRVTIPLLTPVIFFNLIMKTIGGFKAFTQSFIVTEGGPLNSTLFYTVYLYRRGFKYYEMGYASAMAWLLLLVIAVLTILIFRSSDYWVYYESK